MSVQNQYQNLPEKFLERLKRLYTEKELKQVLDAIKNKPLPSFRTNTLKTTSPKLKEQLQNQSFEVQQVPWYQDGFILRNKSTRELTEIEEYKKGQIYIQNLSSMIPAIVLDPKPNETILDLCAAPGSKTTQIAAMMGNQGEILANDISRQRLYKMESILKFYEIAFQKTQSTQFSRISDSQKFRQSDFSDNLSFPSVLISNIPGERLWQLYPEYFDKTLVDVPCSMEGRIRLDDPDSYKDWSIKKIKELQTKQKYLLRSAISATKVGGVIIYSTCTLAPEENEGVIDWVVKKIGDAIELEKITIPNLKLEEGLTYWNKSLNPQISLTSRIFPTESMEGFFIAKIRKVKSTIAPLGSYQR